MYKLIFSNFPRLFANQEVAKTNTTVTVYPLNPSQLSNSQPFHRYRDSAFMKLLSENHQSWARFIPQQCQVRHKWADWRMAKDVRKRKTLAEHAVNKLRVNALRRNDILPKEIKEIADIEITQFPRDAVGRRIRSRCAFTSRGNGNVLKWHVSRIIFRDLADKNLLAGIQRAIW